MNRYRNFIVNTGGHSSKQNNIDRANVLDGYHTPRVATLALLEREPLFDDVWEPCNGFSRISRVLREKGMRVATSDIYRWHNETMVERDFMDFTDLPGPFRESGCDIVTNPPFRQAQLIIEKAMELLHDGGKLCLLLRLQFLEGRKRRQMFATYPPVRVLVFSYRLPRMHQFLYTGPRAGGSALAFAWFIFQKGYHGPTTVEWL